ncbi:MAG: hypothetical protein ABJE10_24095 [bacterium]
MTPYLRLSSIIVLTLLIPSGRLRAQQLAPAAVVSAAQDHLPTPVRTSLLAPDETTSRRVWMSGLKGALIGGLVGGAAALAEGAGGNDCVSSAATGCVTHNHSWEYIGIGASVGLLLGLVAGLTSR